VSASSCSGACPQGLSGFFDFRSADRLPDTIDPAHLMGHCKDVAEFARTHGVTSIYIACAQ